MTNNEIKTRKETDDVWDTVFEAVKLCIGIAFDTCHKIYVLMDDEQLALMKNYGYEEIRKAKEFSPVALMVFLQKWYAESCGLRFINSITTNHENPNAGFKVLIEQGYNWGDTEDEY